MAGTGKTHAAAVGKQLRRRRDALNMSQDELAKKIGGGRRSVTAAENGETAVQLRKRTAWETALHLQLGTISRAYDVGTDLAPIDITGGPAPADPEPWREAEWAVYTAAEPGLTEDDRRRLVDTLRDALDLPPRRDWTPPYDTSDYGESDDARSDDRLA